MQKKITVSNENFAYLNGLSEETKNKELKIPGFTKTINHMIDVCKTIFKIMYEDKEDFYSANYCSTVLKASYDALSEFLVENKDSVSITQNDRLKLCKFYSNLSESKKEYETEICKIFNLEKNLLDHTPEELNKVMESIELYNKSPFERQ